MNQRLRLALIVLVFFGIPALLTLGLIHSDRAHEAVRGAQPGGAIRGRVLGPDGAGLVGVELRLLLDPSAGEPQPDSIAARATSGADGRFELAAPALEGRYTVIAGGGTWQHVARPFSFIGAGGKSELELRVQPGCEFEARFTRADGSAAGSGSYDLEGQPSAGWLSFLGEPSRRYQGRLESGLLKLEGLPPMEVHLFVRFDTGESVELELDLRPGHTQRSVRL
jgi:hypothetical protein